MLVGPEREEKIQQWLFSYLVCHYFLIECERMLERALHRIFFVRETPFAIEVFFPYGIGIVRKKILNLSIYNIIRWVAWTMGQTNRRPSV